GGPRRAARALAAPLAVAERGRLEAVADRDAPADEVPVLERLDGHLLALDVLALARRARQERVASLRGGQEPLHPAVAVEDVERRRAPVERGRRRLDLQDGRDLLREADARVVGAPDVRDVDRRLRARV